MVITLTKEEVRVCSLIALERWLLKQGSKDQPNYATGKVNGQLEHELLANIRANIVEYATAKIYELPWTFPWYPNEEHQARKNHPDVGTKVEVRSIRTRTEIPVWQKDIVKQAIIVGGKVLDPDYYTQVEIYGSIPATAMKPEWYDPTHNCYRVPLTALQAPKNKTS